MTHASGTAATAAHSKESTNSALLEHEGAWLPAQVRVASRSSLFVSFDQARPPSGTVFSKLKLTGEGKELSLGRCRLQLELTVSGVHGRLVFLDDLYDFSALEGGARVVKNLTAYFQEVPLVLGQKEQIRPEFRAWVADLNFDLTTYKRFFNEQDRMLKQEPAAVAEAGQQVLLTTAGREFFRFLDEQLERLRELVGGFTPEEHERHGFYFRQQMWPFILGAEFMKRTNLKPRGYAGDATMMQMLYDNEYVGQYVFNKLMHKHPLEHPAAQAVRNRRMLVPQMLREVLAEHPEKSNFRVLSVACGPAREVEDVFTCADDVRRVELTLLDQDPEALDSAKQSLAGVEARLGAPVRANRVMESVRTMLKSRELTDSLGRFDFAYSMGLFDYLTPPVARAVLTKIYEMLAPGGVAIVGNYHVSNPSRYYMAYWLDWALYYRSEDEMLQMAERLPGATARVGMDESGSQMFLRVEKGTDAS